jgi:hypothetical protein
MLSFFDIVFSQTAKLFQNAQPTFGNEVYFKNREYLLLKSWKFEYLSLNCLVLTSQKALSTNFKNN